MAKAEPEYLVCSLDEIVPEYDWNCRSKARTLLQGVQPEEDGDPDSPGLEGLAESLAANGQDTEVDAWPGPKGSKRLATGYRRYSAARLLESQGRSILGLPKGHIKVKFHPDMTELEARRLNLSENANRKNLKGPDLVHGIKKLVELDKSITAEMIQVTFSIGPSYASKIMTLAKKLSAPVYAQWRDSATKPLDFASMLEVAKLPKEEQQAQYDLLLAAHIKDTTKDEKKWIKLAVKNGHKIGVRLGALQRVGFLTVSEDLNWADEKYLRELVKFKTRFKGKPISDKTLARIASAVSNAFIEEKNRTPEESEEPDLDDEEDDEAA